MLTYTHLRPELYTAWNDFCIGNSDAWFYHTTHYIDYLVECNPSVRNLSFMVTENGNVLAVCSLFLENGKFSIGDSYVWAPAVARDLGSRKQEQVRRKSFEVIDSLAIFCNVTKCSLSIDPLSHPQYNYLMRFGYIPTSINTQIVSLEPSLRTLKSQLSKGHDYDVDVGIKTLETKIFTSQNITQSVFDKYHSLHTKDAGRETRDLKSWNMILDWIQAGHAILLQANLSGRDIGYSCVITYKDSSYYGSACSDPEYPDLPIGHALTWATIGYLKEHNFQWYEIGWQHYTEQPYDHCSQKEISISKFKRGFGGITVPLFRGEKYYSRDLFMKEYTERMERYAEGLRKDTAIGAESSV